MKNFKLNEVVYKRITTLGSTKKVAVGIVEKQEHTDGIDMATLMARHFYGVISQNLPSRDAYVKPLLNHKEKAIDKIALLLKQLPLENYTEEAVFNIIGKQVLEEIVKESFRSGGFGEWEALSQTTIDKKGHSQILVDKGELMNAQSFKVIDK